MKTSLEFFSSRPEVEGIPLNASLRSYSSRAVSDATAADEDDESLVQQQFKDEVDINTIVRRFGLTREMPSGIAGGVYGDFTGIQDYEGAVAAIEKAHEGFMKMPPELRERFGNDPGKLIAFAQSVDAEQFVRAFEPSRDPETGRLVEPPKED